jgi:hypothetical protein
MKRFILDPTKAAGDKYSLIVTPSVLARMASSAETLRKAMEISARLTVLGPSVRAEAGARSRAICWHLAATLSLPQSLLRMAHREFTTTCLHLLLHPKGVPQNGIIGVA